MIEMGKQYQTRDGRVVRILATDRKSAAFGRTVTGLVESLNGKEEDPHCWFPDGRHEAETWSCYDLIPIPTKHEGWIVLDTTDYALYSSKEVAKRTIGDKTRGLVAHVTWED